MDRSSLTENSKTTPWWRRWAVMVFYILLLAALALGGYGVWGANCLMRSIGAVTLVVAVLYEGVSMFVAPGEWLDLSWGLPISRRASSEQMVRFEGTLIMAIGMLLGLVFVTVLLPLRVCFKSSGS